MNTDDQATLIAAVIVLFVGLVKLAFFGLVTYALLKVVGCV